jgi:hypothetical protein
VEGARGAQQRAIVFTLLLALPCVAAFLVVPDLIMRALFMRGKFTAGDANAAAMTLAAYTIGLIPFVLMRSVVATFLARGDTATTVKAALTAAAANIALKVVFLYTTALAQIGLALATSLGAWINFALILWFGMRAGFIAFDAAFWRDVGRLAAAAVAVAVALWIAQWPVLAFTAGFSAGHNVFALMLLGFVGAVVYGAADLGLFGKAGGCAVGARQRRTRLLPLLRHQSERARLAEPQHADLDRLADALAGEQADQVVRPVTGSPSSRTIMSPVSRPARLAGLPAPTRDGRGRDSVEAGRKLHAARDRGLLRGDADEGAAHAAVPHQLAEHELRRVGRRPQSRCPARPG